MRQDVSAETSRPSLQPPSWVLSTRRIAARMLRVLRLEVDPPSMGGSCAL